MNQKWIALVLLALGANFACAASFDCDKAGTKVEKMICADSELSKLDEELGKAYVSAGEKVTSANRDQFKVNQRHWLKERNQCTDSACLREKYNTRLAFFHDVEVSAAQFSSGKKLYPPYPDVWERRFPLFKGRQSFFPYSAGDGDVVISYVIGELKFPRFDRISISFFAGKSIGRLTEESGWVLGSAEKGIDVALRDKAKLSLKNSDHRQPARCPQTLYFYYLLEYPDGRKEKKSILYLPDSPEVSEIGDRCVDTREKSVREPVVALQGTMVPLDDGGFLLLVNDIGLVLRFDRDFNTKSSLLNKTLFVVDTDELEKRIVHEHEGINYQQTQDALFDYLQGLKE